MYVKRDPGALGSRGVPECAGSAGYPRGQGHDIHGARVLRAGDTHEHDGEAGVVE